MGLKERLQQQLSPEYQKQVFEDVSAAMAEKYPGNNKAHCLYWAYALRHRLLQDQIPTIVQGGTALWPRMRPDQDDKESPTHFGYVWDPDSRESRMALSAGALPEMHVWNVIPVVRHVIDLTTHAWPTRCWEMIHYDWIGDKPPEFMWCHFNSLPDHVVYKPISPATMLAQKLFNRLDSGRLAFGSAPGEATAHGKFPGNP